MQATFSAQTVILFLHGTPAKTMRQIAKHIGGGTVVHGNKIIADVGKLPEMIFQAKWHKVYKLTLINSFGEATQLRIG